MEEKQFIQVLERLKEQGTLRIALLFGSYARGEAHARSDIDLAIYLEPADAEEEMVLIDAILMSCEKTIGLLRLDNDEESPFIVQEALKGKHLIEPDPEALYSVYDRVLHETESIRLRRGVAGDEI